ncbi:MAG: HipA domain-containing protein [Gemmatimonadetes bacterium]|nr:HipA domain-containing protein [Gemmatimonadota bacterium]
MSALVVWRDTHRVGVLEYVPNGGARFTYDPAVVAARDPGLAIGVRCPVRAAPYVGQPVDAIFENLLPEGDLRRVLAQGTKHDVGDIIGLLGVVGGDCAGALHLWPEGTEPPATPRYASLTPDELTQAFTVAEGQLRQAVGRASLSGMQPKLALYRLPPVGDVPGGAPTYRIPANGAPSTVVVKKPNALYPHMLEAEMVGMRLMAAAGVPTASSARCVVAPECHESARFDRTVAPGPANLADGTEPLVSRRHAEDGCQITGRTSRSKYATTGGPSYQELVAVLTRWSITALADREHLFRWAMVNAAIGNYDGHAKNLSVVYVGPAQLQLAPAYDVVITAIYPALDRTFGLGFGGTIHPRALTPRSLATAAREFRLTERRARDLAAEVITRLRVHQLDVMHAVHTLGGTPAALDAVQASVIATTDDLTTRLAL